ncbi:MAG TPA: GTP 3',8-cyclase MoaA [Dehalococcoidia bacterium]|nr:GTP 3',8-cyclase MoaA [Dehalococcoidia bacterium]
MSDSFQRPINYLRISVTDQCNLRCFYCMPEKGLALLPKDHLLTYAEMALVVRAAVGLGINRVRLTGGEPLVRAGLVDLVSMLSRIDGLEDISLTTNGVLLAGLAPALKRAGLRRVNVSLDTFDPQVFRRITGRDRLKAVLKGIDAAREIGLDPVKINTVVIPGVNDSEFLAFGRKSMEGWHVRFIELMPFGQARGLPTLSVSQMVASLEEAFGPLIPAAAGDGGPARYFRFLGARGTIGFISPVTRHFCFACNRLRLTSAGRLRPCLLQESEVDMRVALRNRASLAELRDIIRMAAAQKPLRHRLEERKGLEAECMSRLGG